MTKAALGRFFYFWRAYGKAKEGRAEGYWTAKQVQV